MKILVFALLALGCCEEVVYEQAVPPACADKAAAFIARCVSGAVKLADVDQDYVVLNCQHAAEETFGAPRPQLHHFDSWSACFDAHPLCKPGLEQWRADGEALCRKESP